MSIFSRTVASKIQLILAGLLVLNGAFLIAADESPKVADAKQSTDESQAANPLRGSDKASDTPVDTNQKDSVAKKQVVRGSKPTEKPSAPAAIDFIIKGHDDSMQSEAAKQNSTSVSPDGPKPDAKVQATETSPNTADKVIKLDSTGIAGKSESDIHVEYEILHYGKSPQITGSDVIVLGEDTDNPAFETKAGAVSKSDTNEVPASLDDVQDTEIVLELGEIDVEFPAEDYPEDETAADESDENAAEKSDRDSNEHAAPNTMVEAEDAKETGTAVNVAAKPTLRRPKPISIEPLQPQSTASDIKLENISKPKDVAASSSKPTMDANEGKPLPKLKEVTATDGASQLRLQRIDATLNYYMNNPESATERSPWAVMHAILPFGADAELVYRNERVNAIAWMSSNRVCKTQTIFSSVGNNFRPNVGGGVQGHDGQFLAILAQSNVSSQYPISVRQKQFKIENLVQFEMANCKPKTELTFRLIGLAYYIGTKQSWRSRDRQVWNVERLLGEELAQPINGAACGGTHRLMGIYRAIEQRKQENMPMTGKFAVAEKYIAEYKDYAWTLQNPDGSFSTNWFESRGAENNDERKVQTTGHILEWLVYSSTLQELRAHRTDAAIDFLISKIYNKRTHKWPIGPRGHALRAIALYREKMYEVTSVGSSKAASALLRSESGNKK